MDTEITPTQLAIEYLRRDKSNLSPAQYLKKLKQLELEFTDLLALSSNELKEEIYFAWRLGVHVHKAVKKRPQARPFLCLTVSIWQAVC